MGFVLNEFSRGILAPISPSSFAHIMRFLCRSQVPALWLEDPSVVEMFHSNSPFDDEEFKFEKPFSRQNSLGHDGFDEISQNSLDVGSLYTEGLNLENEFLWEQDFSSFGPTLAQLNDDQRSRSPLINPDMQSLYYAATKTVGESSDEDSQPTSQPPREQPNASATEDVKEEKIQSQLMNSKTGNSDSAVNSSSSATTASSTSSVKIKIEREEDEEETDSNKNSSHWPSTIVRPVPVKRETRKIAEKTSSPDMDFSQVSSKLSQHAKLDSKPLKLPQLISPQQHSQIYSLNELRSKSGEDQVAERENTTSPLNVENSDSEGDMDIDSDEDFDEDNFSPNELHSSCKPRKGRRGELDDLNPNPHRLLQIGRELDKLNKTISDLKPIHQLPMSAKNKSRKEKNKLASR